MSADHIAESARCTHCSVTRGRDDGIYWCDHCGHPSGEADPAKRAAEPGPQMPSGCPGCGRGDGLCGDCCEDGVFSFGDSRYPPEQPDADA